MYLWLPRFRVRARASVRLALESLGMPTAFGEQANFSGMHEPHPEPLTLSDIVHEAYADVNEERTEAAAATATMLFGRGGKSDEPKPVELRCDRPFLFVIRDAMPGAILFAGRVMNPTAG